MRLFMGQFGRYKVTALQERREAGWRVRTWSDGKGGPGHDYWVENGQFYAIQIEMPLYSVEEQCTIGENGDSSVARAEREAILNMIAKWEADGLDQRSSASDNGQEAFKPQSRVQKRTNGGESVNPVSREGYRTVDGRNMASAPIATAAVMEYQDCD